MAKLPPKIKQGHASKQNRSFRKKQTKFEGPNSTFLGTNVSLAKTLFWVDDFPNFPLGENMYPFPGGTWKIIPVSKWLITVVSFCPLRIGLFPFQMAELGEALNTCRSPGMILQVLNKSRLCRTETQLPNHCMDTLVLDATAQGRLRR